MPLVIPSDIKAETIYNYLGDMKKDVSFMGDHKRNAYEDVNSIEREENDSIKICLSKQGIYDVLPEALFHPIDRFDNIPANEYKERFAEEVEQQRIEEEQAREFFSLFDRFIFNLSCSVDDIKQTYFSDNSILGNIICDELPDNFKSNRFIKRIIEFTPQCSVIRGDRNKITLMLRKILAEEGLKLIPSYKSQTITDISPKYNCDISQEEEPSDDVYLGNSFDESILNYDIQYWNDDYCDASFLYFVNEIKEFEDFLNDYFMGIEDNLHFNISTHTLPVRLSDEMSYNYLNYNTNL